MCRCYTCGWKACPSGIGTILKRASAHVKKCNNPYTFWQPKKGDEYEYWLLGFR